MLQTVTNKTSSGCYSYYKSGDKGIKEFPKLSFHFQTRYSSLENTDIENKYFYKKFS